MSFVNKNNKVFFINKRRLFYTNFMNYLCGDPSHSYECFQTPRSGRGFTSALVARVASKPGQRKRPLNA
jgi:hypothetical protein